MKIAVSLLIVAVIAGGAYMFATRDSFTEKDAIAALIKAKGLSLTEEQAKCVTQDMKKQKIAYSTVKDGKITAEVSKIASLCLVKSNLSDVGDLLGSNNSTTTTL